MSSYPPIQEIPHNPALTGLAAMLPDITYSTQTGVPLKLALLLPWSHLNSPSEKAPLIVFVQGSGWTFPNIYFEIPQLSEYARNGYVVATVTHRNAKDGHPFPAYLQDVKCAIRFLRSHAEEYGIDPQRVAIWGTSSGGNTAMLVGLTGDDPRFETPEYAGFSDSVRAVVQCFGPTDVPRLFDATVQSDPQAAAASQQEGSAIFGLCGGPPQEHREVGDAMSPINYIKTCAEKPPFFMLQGDADPVVPYEQCLSMYHALCDADADVQMVRVHGAPHEGSFWSREVHSRIAAFLSEKL